MNHVTEFEKEFVAANYGVETLINGNITECLEYLRRMKKTGLTGEMLVHEELTNIKSLVPERYEYIKSKVFKP